MYAAEVLRPVHPSGATSDNRDGSAEVPAKGKFRTGQKIEHVCRIARKKVPNPVLTLANRHERNVAPMQQCGGRATLHRCHVAPAQHVDMWICGNLPIWQSADIALPKWQPGSYCPARMADPAGIALPEWQPGSFCRVTSTHPPGRGCGAGAVAMGWTYLWKAGKKFLANVGKNTTPQRIAFRSTLPLQLGQPPSPTPSPDLSDLPIFSEGSRPPRTTMLGYPPVRCILP